MEVKGRGGTGNLSSGEKSRNYLFIPLKRSAQTKTNHRGGESLQIVIVRSCSLLIVGYLEKEKHFTRCLIGIGVTKDPRTCVTRHRGRYPRAADIYN